jgi:hypothetical protein
MFFKVQTALLLFVFILIMISVSTAKECKNVIPGFLSFLTAGWNVVEYDVDSMPYGGQARYSFYAVTCNLGQKWTMPGTNITYDVPDVVALPIREHGHETEI